MNQIMYLKLLETKYLEDVNLLQWFSYLLNSIIIHDLGMIKVSFLSSSMVKAKIITIKLI